eukprot:Protomagalhaensia_sp_Gyna_25__3551@NODE_3194_length_687_cov_2_245370_g2676_i0_p1_GENE_NODE_3194_length_687_cov_2_245370_g2676_i0NODE_3194_length_687_cov_2_245370_g2676_i0_p1_ORF_typecomplete_len174_score16_37_NODE_3194_length_687_cov_2_245370_g2676_i0164646
MGSGLETSIQSLLSQAGSVDCMESPFKEQVKGLILVWPSLPRGATRYSPDSEGVQHSHKTSSKGQSAIQNDPASTRSTPEEHIRLNRSQGPSTRVLGVHDLEGMESEGQSEESIPNSIPDSSQWTHPPESVNEEEPKRWTVRLREPEMASVQSDWDHHLG